MKNAFCPATALYGSAALAFVNPTRVSYYAAPKMTSFAAFIKESRMRFAEPIGLNRKSGAAEGSVVPRTFPGNVFRRSVPGFPIKLLSNRVVAMRATLGFGAIKSRLDG
jgi:hypothetical protein